jgi:polysaccharide export outer membrane protein
MRRYAVLNMMKKFTFMIVAFGFLTAGVSRGQQTAPKVPPSVESNQPPCIAVYGAVRAPAMFVLRRPARLAEVIAMAGGVTARAGESVQVIHTRTPCYQPGQKSRSVSWLDSRPEPPGQSDSYVLSEVARPDERSNPLLRAGDVVIVTVQNPIYVVGSVVAPRELYSKEPLTLSQAIKLAGGPSRNAEINKVVVYAPRQGAVFLAKQFDLGAIRKHREKDPMLEPYDIVFVPSLGARMVGPPLGYPSFDTRPLIPLKYRVIY